MASAVDMINAVGTVRFVEIDPPRGQDPEEFIAYMVKAPIVVAGYGGWSRVARPRRKAITEWVGRDSMSIELEFLVDTWEDVQGEWTERNIRSLERLAGIDIQDPQPPLFRLHSKPENLMPHGYRRAPHVKWFVDTLTWDKDSVIVSTVGNRKRAGGVLVITQFVADERLTPSARRRGAGGGSRSGGGGSHAKGGRRKTYTVKPTDTLQKIAARRDVYGDPKKWKRIATENHIRDPLFLVVGRELRIP